MKGLFEYHITQSYRDVLPFKRAATRERVVMDNLSGTFWVLCEDRGNPVAVCGCFIREKTARIKSVWVNPAYRNQGIFRTMLDQSLQEIDARGANLVTCFATPMSRPGFEKRGFRVVSWKKDIAYMTMQLPVPAEPKVEGE